MEQQRLYRRVLRRETHASRTAPATTVAIIVIVAVLFVAAVQIAAVVQPEIAELQQQTIAQLTDSTALQLIVAGVAAVLGIMLLLSAVLPGGKAKRARTSERSALVIDDGVYADAVADAIARATGLASSQLRVTVAKQRATVMVTPTSGVDVDRNAIAETVRATGASLQLPLHPRVVVLNAGVVA